MNPEQLPRPQNVPEAPSFSPDTQPGAERQANTPEMSPDRSREYEQSMKAVDQATGPGQPAVAVPLPTVVPAPPTPVQAANPVTAADDDLIEKEWVDKAKSIITSTQGDPYAREREINKLQADYLLKRYGKELGVAA